MSEYIRLSDENWLARTPAIRRRGSKLERSHFTKAGLKQVPLAPQPQSNFHRFKRAQGFLRLVFHAMLPLKQSDMTDFAARTPTA